MRAYDAAVEAIKIGALAAAETQIEQRAIAFERDPRQLDSIEPGMSTLSPKALLTSLNHLTQWNRLHPRRYFGFGGEINAINIAAAKRYAHRLINGRSG